MTGTVNEETLRAAMAPGTAKAKAICEAVAGELAGQPAAQVHAELVKRLEAEPFEWDDEQLQDLATSISDDSSKATTSSESTDSAEATEAVDLDQAAAGREGSGDAGLSNGTTATDDQSDFGSQPVDPDAGTPDAGANPGHHEGGAGDASLSAAEGVTGGAPNP